MNTSPNAAVIVLIWAAIILAYWAPSAVAGIRHVRNLGSVIVVNLFTGWTVIGWIVALAMACRTREPSPQEQRGPPIARERL